MRKSNDEVYQLTKNHALVKKLKNKRFRPFCLCPPDVMFVTRGSKNSLFFVFDSLSNLDCGQYIYIYISTDTYLSTEIYKIINSTHQFFFRDNPAMVNTKKIMKRNSVGQQFHQYQQCELSPFRLTKHKNKHDIWCLKSMSWFGTETKKKGFNWLMRSRSSLLINGSPASNAFINKRVHLRSSQKWMRTININIDSRIAGSLDAQI